MFTYKSLIRNNFNLVVYNFNLNSSKYIISQLFHNQSERRSQIDDDNNNENSRIQNNVEITTDFEKEFYAKKIDLSPFQNAFLAAGSAIMALADPRRNDLIAALGETTGTEALNNILMQMRQSYEGSDILTNKPRINTSTVNLNELRQLPSDTFGHTYVKFLDDNKVTPDSRLGVRFIDDIDLGYVMQRYRECHDLYHAVLGMPTNMLGEVTVKWFEALNTKLPMCIGGAMFGALRLRPKQRALYREYYLPWALRTGQNVPLLLSIYWERRWEQRIDDLREELRIKTLEITK